MPTNEADTANQGDTPNQQDTPAAGDTPNGDQQQATPDKGGNGGSTPTIPDTLPDDHPVIKQWKADKDKLAKANEKLTELAEARAQASKATKLEEELSARPTQEALDTLQSRYDRLEAFLQEAGGPLSRALDSRSFTRDLFETDKDIEDIVKAWHQANPSETSTALGSKAAQPASKKPDMNKLLRAAIKDAH